MLAKGFCVDFAASANAGVDTETDANDVILAGHDAVAYFTDNKPVLGRHSVSLTVVSMSTRTSTSTKSGLKMYRLVGCDR